MARKFAAVGGGIGVGPQGGLKSCPKKKKNNTKDDSLSKKVTSPSIGDQQEKSPSRHGAGKGLMIGKGPVGLGPV